jgi:hypothetical protein
MGSDRGVTASARRVRLKKGGTRAACGRPACLPRSGWISEPGVAQRTPGHGGEQKDFLPRRGCIGAALYNPSGVNQILLPHPCPGVRCATPGSDIQPLRGKEGSRAGLPEYATDRQPHPRPSPGPFCLALLALMAPTTRRLPQGLIAMALATAPACGGPEGQAGQLARTLRHGSMRRTG